MIGQLDLDGSRMKAGIGASVPREEDERFLRGRGQYVGDFQMPGMRDVAFVRSPLAHARLHSVVIPEKHKDAVVTADDLTGINPIKGATSVSGFKHFTGADPCGRQGAIRR